MKFLLVEWRDAVADTGWEDIKKKPLPALPCTTIGWLILETQREITLASTIGTHNDLTESNNRMTIPKGWITKRREVKL